MKISLNLKSQQGKDKLEARLIIVGQMKGVLFYFNNEFPKNYSEKEERLYGEHIIE